MQSVGFEATARANAQLALMIAISEFQKNAGTDQRMAAPSGILGSNPDSAAADGLANPHLTGVWNARDAARESLDRYNTTPPDYSRDKPDFQSWLVSNAKTGNQRQSARRHVSLASFTPQSLGFRAAFSKDQLPQRISWT